MRGWWGVREWWVGGVRVVRGWWACEGVVGCERVVGRGCEGVVGM